MKPYYLLFLLMAGALIFVVAKPQPEMRQAQEASPMVEEVSRDTFRLSIEIENEDQRPIADILWFQEAARLALDEKVPWFNVLEQKIGEDSVEGVIQLEGDPMKAEYDANEILSLNLPDENLE